MDEFLGPPDEGERLLALGRVANEAGLLELTLRGVAGGILDGPNVWVILAGQGVSWLIDNCLAVLNDPGDGCSVAALSHADRERLRALVIACREPYQQRNDVLHGGWIDDGLAYIISKRRNAKSDLRPTLLTDLNRIADDLRRVNHELCDAANRLPGIMRAFPLQEGPYRLAHHRD